MKILYFLLSKINQNLLMTLPLTQQGTLKKTKFQIILKVVTCLKRTVVNRYSLKFLKLKYLVFYKA